MRIAELEAGRLPIYEPGLGQLLDRNRDRLRFTTSSAEVFERARLAFVCVGTPPTYSGDADLSAVWQVVDELPDRATDFVSVMKSTVPPGTGERVRAWLDARGLTQVGYVSNPGVPRRGHRGRTTSCGPTESSSARSERGGRPGRTALQGARRARRAR